MVPGLMRHHGGYKLVQRTAEAPASTCQQKGIKERVINSSDPVCTLRVQIWHKRWPSQLRGYLRVAGNTTHLDTARGKIVQTLQGVLVTMARNSGWCPEIITQESSG